MSVLMHEIGHLFGLDHSSNPKSIMSPLFYFGSDEILEEDIKNLRMILGLESRKFLNSLLNSLFFFIFDTALLLFLISPQFSLLLKIVLIMMIEKKLMKKFRSL